MPWGGFHPGTRAGVREQTALNNSNPARRGFLPAATCFLLLVQPLAQAGDLDGDAEAARPEVVITATRSPTDVTQVAVPVIVLTRADIERSLAGDVAGLLAAQPGVEIARNGGPGQASAIFVRGTSSNHTMVLVDGVRVNPGTIGGAALQNIQPESIERIELVEGARSSLYGSDAIGGVLNIITRAGAARGFSAFASAGRYGAHTLGLDGGADAGPLQLGGSFAHQAAIGFPPAVGASDRGDYANDSGNLQARLALGAQAALEAQAWRASGHNAYSNFGTPADQDYTDASYAAALRVHAAAGAEGRVAVTRAQSDYDQREVADFDHTRRDALEAQGSLPRGAQRFTAGVLLASEHASSLSFGLPYDVTTHSLLVYGQDQWHRADDDLLLAVGYTRHENFGSHTTGNAEYARTLGRPGGGPLQASVALGTAFHAPEATDRFGFGGNPALKPETSRQGELGLRWQGGPLQLRLAAFENRLDGLIQYVPIDPVNFVYQAQNIDRARIRGAELGGEWRSGAWRLRGHYDIQDPRDLADGSALLRRARRNAGFNALWERGAGYASLDLQAAGARPDFGGGRLGGYTLLGFGAGWRFHTRTELQLKLENALDRRYELAGGYRTPGRSLTLALRQQLR
jgi:vitamin B12 transporter